MPSITRRSVIAGSVGSILTRPLFAAEDLQRAIPTEIAPERATLSGKRALLKRSWRPPNFETPLADLRQPFTANDAFFVRYHLPVIPEVDARTWRLRVGGPAAQRAVELSLDDLKRGFERVSVAAVNQCSGNRRGLFTPRVPGVQWTHGAMGNALWTGVRLRDVLAKARLQRRCTGDRVRAARTAVLPATPGFAKSLPVDKALDENTLIAFEMNGRPLPHWNGAPARLVVPGWTATYWMKHLTRDSRRATGVRWLLDEVRVSHARAARFPARALRARRRPRRCRSPRFS